MVENVLDLKHRVLKDTGTILPGLFDLYFDPVTLKEEYRVPYLQDMSVQGIDFGFLHHHSDTVEYKPASYSRRPMEKADSTPSWQHLDQFLQPS